MNIIKTYKSPNYSSRQQITIDTIVIHSTASSGVKGTIDWLTSKESKVSAHYLIDKSGNIYELVDTKYAAWHSGKCKIPYPNLRSIGIELVNKNDGIDKYPKKQLDALIGLIMYLKNKYPSIKFIYGHYEISKSGKTDPKGLSIESIRNATGIKEKLMEV